LRHNKLVDCFNMSKSTYSLVRRRAGQPAQLFEDEPVKQRTHAKTYLSNHSLVRRRAGQPAQLFEDKQVNPLTRSKTSRSTSSTVRRRTCQTTHSFEDAPVNLLSLSKPSRSTHSLIRRRSRPRNGEVLLSAERKRTVRAFWRSCWLCRPKCEVA